MKMINNEGPWFDRVLVIVCAIVAGVLIFAYLTSCVTINLYTVEPVKKDTNPTYTIPRYTLPYIRPKDDMPNWNFSPYRYGGDSIGIGSYKFIDTLRFIPKCDTTTYLYGGKKGGGIFKFTPKPDSTSSIRRYDGRIGIGTTNHTPRIIYICDTAPSIYNCDRITSPHPKFKLEIK